MAVRAEDRHGAVQGGAPEAESRQHAHHVPLKTYLAVGLFLALVTAIEVAVPYIPAFKGMATAALLSLAAIKFGAVAAFFMHLKYDRRVLTWVFAAGLALGMLVVVAMMIVMNV